MKNAKTKILFICWDSPSVRYLEGLFVPIFEVLIKDYNYEVHIVQFSWANKNRVDFLRAFCEERGITYCHRQVSMRPVPAVGKYLTLFRGGVFLKNYIKQNQIGVVMPRSTMPAKMILSIRKSIADVPVVFDADGLPIEERVDFAGLVVGSFRHRELKRIERRILNAASIVLTRTAAAAQFLSATHHVDLKKFNVVRNGTNELLFHFNADERRARRTELGIPIDARVLVYSGSLGPQYGLEQMLYIFRKSASFTGNIYFLILTNNPGFLERKMSSDEKIIVRNCSLNEVPGFLSAADVAFAIRKATFSMKGVAPIKIGEYLLSGLPVIASSGIGDSESILSGQPFAFILSSYDEPNLDAAVEWIFSQPAGDAKLRDAIRDFGIDNFSVKKSGESYQKALRKLS